MADWEEIRQLAADFRRVQESTSAHKLSERNCIEVVTRLIETGLIQLVYTLDGKEYVTPQQLEKEITNELLAHQGRINIIDLQSLLNVDLSHVEGKVNDMLKHDRSLTLLQGELISRKYIDALCEEINDNLQESGQINVADISKNFALPNNFLLEVLEASMGEKIQGELDKSGSGTIYTEAYVNRYRSHIRGIFSAVTCPSSVGPIIAQGGFQEKLFLSVLHKLISSRQLHGSLHGHGDKAIYIPDIFLRMQNKWSDSFLSSNGYLEYDALGRLGIDDPQGYVSRRYCTPEETVVQLVTCALGDSVLKELEGTIDDIHNSEVGWIDVLQLLPTPCTPEDAQLLLHKKYGDDNNLRLFEGYVTTNKFIQSCSSSFLPLIKEKALETASKHSTLLSELNSQDTAAVAAPSGKTGRARTGKEKRTAKNRERKGGSSSTQLESISSELRFMTKTEIVEELRKLLEDEALSLHIAESIEGELQSAFLREAVSSLSVVESSSHGQVSAGELKKRHSNLQERLQGLWNTANLFKKGIDHFEGESAIQLSKYLLKTLCSDLMNMVVLYLAEDLGVANDTTTELSSKERSGVIVNFPEHIKKLTSSVNSTLNGKDVSLFFESFLKLCGEDYCGFMIKKLDRKKERQLIFSHRQSLQRNLDEEQEHAMALHIIVVLLFQQKTNCIIHIPGKFVPTMIMFLSEHVPRKEHLKLVECQRLISAKWKSTSQAEEPPRTRTNNSDEDSIAVGTQNSSEDETAIQTLIQDVKSLVSN